MTDVLLDRFAALADAADDSDWLDVRRRARRRGRVVVAATAAAAAIVATAAIGAAGAWMFSSHDRHVTAETRVAVAGRTWRVSITTLRAGRLCFRVTGSNAASPSPLCTDGRRRRLKLPFAAAPFDVPGGQIWVGASVGFERRIAITDARGHVHSTRALAAPRGTKTPLRYWAIAIEGTTARSIAAYDAHGRSIRKSLR